MIYKDGSVYKGDWHNDKRAGKGEMTYSDGSVYTGEWKNDKKNGSGEQKYTKQMVSG